MNDGNKPPMVVWLKPSTAARDDDSGTFWPGPTGATLAYMHPKDKSEAYIHLDQFLEEVERRAMEIGYNVTKPSFEQVGEAMQELAKEIEEGKA